MIAEEGMMMELVRNIPDVILIPFTLGFVS